ncbi:hypothetical protein GKE82_18995 [Conexibacter sp. W3-3-2]|uniref:hypothetical protein n=1 Tax=Conexibacter sp. W3-3-2 TaxID=2675227 RepID=UPI0012B77789|nr:hypothetical protein [Conexibacter sp. W3-3-2]MTD46316.1 hypothetical protein [Conexibacter sp. W3-3-2]
MVLAHAGDVLVSMIYLAPVVILVGALVVARHRDNGDELREWDDEDDDLLDLGDDQP